MDFVKVNLMMKLFFIIKLGNIKINQLYENRSYN